MFISNDSWTWERTTKKAHELSLCNKDVTFYVIYDPSMGTYSISDRDVHGDARGYWECHSRHLNGKRV